MATEDIMEKNMLEVSSVSMVRGLSLEGSSCNIKIEDIQSLLFSGIRTVIAGDMDWNYIDFPGVYTFGFAVGGLNSPRNHNYGILLVFKAGDFIVQLSFPDTYGLDDNKIAWRIKYSSDWRNWCYISFVL